MSLSPNQAPMRSVMDWPAILAGAAIAAGVMVVFTGFTAAIGLGSISAEPNEGLGTFAAILVGLFGFVSTVAAYALGGYVAGRMRTPVAGIGADEMRARDGTHGLAVWAIGTLVGAMLTLGLVSGGLRAAGSAATTAVEAGGAAVGGALQGAGQLAGGVASGVGQAAGAAVQGAADAADGGSVTDMLPEGLQQNPVDYITGRLLRPADTATAVPDDEAIGREIAGIIGTVLRTGDLPQDDRDYLVRIVSQRTEVPPQQVETRVDQAVTEVQTIRTEAEDRMNQARDTAQELRDAAQKQLDDAKQAAIDAAETARRAAVWTAFLLAASALIAGVAAFLAAIRGGHDREEGRVWAGLHRGIRPR